MPRPSIAEQRKAEILDAFEACILKDSLEATSLEKLAQQASMKRSILRHYIGNRDDIIVALSNRYNAYYDELWATTLTLLPESRRAHSLIEILFGERDKSYIDKVIIGEAIFAQAKRLDQVRANQIAYMQNSVNIIANELSQSYPDIDPSRIALIARGIFANYLNSESLLPLGLQKDIDELKQVCFILLETINSQ